MATEKRYISNEASDMGFPPGRWPLQFTHTGDVWKHVGFARNEDGEIMWAVYVCPVKDLIMRVYND